MCRRIVDPIVAPPRRLYVLAYVTATTPIPSINISVLLGDRIRHLTSLLLQLQARRTVYPSQPQPLLHAPSILTDVVLLTSKSKILPSSRNGHIPVRRNDVTFGKSCIFSFLNSSDLRLAP